MARKPVDPQIRFWTKVNKNGPVAKNRPDLGCCWIWTGNFGSGTYGIFWDGQRMINAHKFAFGEVPTGLEIDHFACDCRACVNPSYMVAVTHADNMKRTRRTHCPKGHPYDEVNTYHRPDGKGRGCLTCRNS